MKPHFSNTNNPIDFPKSEMNERIKELIEQATTILEPNDPDYRFEFFDKEKFAQLMIKECADRIRFCIKNDIDFIAEDIEKHFGVEE